MLRTWIICSVLLTLAARVSAEGPPAFRSDMDKVNYGIGVDVVRNFQSQGVKINLDLLIQGLKDGLSGKVTISDKELRKIMTGFQTELRQRQSTTRRLAALDNRKKSGEFLAANRSKDGVATLPSGLQYQILTVGAGKKPGEQDTVECTYRGALIDGTPVDSSHEAGYPAIFKLSEGALPGWREALLLMPVGSKWRLFIPPQLGYGERGAGRLIGPNETLIYEMELLAIK
jgi:FKBP-type peptidyl-prolyl cis-trans isomerase